MALLATICQRLIARCQTLKKVKPSNLVPLPCPSLYSNFLLTSRLSRTIFSNRSISRNYRRRQLDPSGVFPPLPERTQTFGIYLTRRRYSHRANIRRTTSRPPRDESLSLDAFYGRTTRVHLFFSFSFRSLFFSFLLFLFLSSSSLGEKSLRRVDTEPAHFDKRSDRYCRSMDFTLAAKRRRDVIRN